MASGAGARRVAVIGGTGFIGSHLVDRIEAAGHPLLVVGRQRAAARRAHPPDTSFATADVTQPETLRAVLEPFRPEVVYHLAAVPDAAESPAHIQNAASVNMLGTLHAFEAAAAAGAQLFVYGDSTKNYGNGAVPYRSHHPDAPLCSYAVAKAAGWRMVEIAALGRNIEICSIRPTFVYGPRQNFCLVQYVHDCHRRGEPVRLQGGRQTRDLLYVRDAAEAFYRVMHSPKARGMAIPIGGGNEMRVSDLCRTILDVLGSAVEVVEGVETTRPSEIWRSYCDNAEATELLDWKPAYTLEQGLRELYGVDAAQNRANADPRLALREA